MFASAVELKKPSGLDLRAILLDSSGQSSAGSLESADGSDSDPLEAADGGANLECFAAMTVAQALSNAAAAADRADRRARAVVADARRERESQEAAAESFARAWSLAALEAAVGDAKLECFEESIAAMAVQQALSDAAAAARADRRSRIVVAVAEARREREEQEAAAESFARAWSLAALGQAQDEAEFQHALDQRAHERQRAAREKADAVARDVRRRPRKGPPSTELTRAPAHPRACSE